MRPKPRYTFLRRRGPYLYWYCMSPTWGYCGILADDFYGQMVKR